MAIIVKDSGGSFTPAPQGAHVAICIAIIELGTQEYEWQGQHGSNFKVCLGFEIPGELNEETGEPYRIYRDYTASLAEKANLRAHLRSWRGRDFTEAEAEAFELDKLLGKPCLVTVIHKTSGKGRTYGVLDSITNLPKGMNAPVATVEPFTYEIGMKDGGTWDKLPEWIQEKVKKSREWNFAVADKKFEQAGAPTDADYIPSESEDDLPF